MADLADVENALKALMLGAIYPTGQVTGQSAIVLNSARLDCVANRGWPQKEQLEADLKAGLTVIAIHSPSQAMRNTTRYPTDWVDLTTPIPTLTLTVGANTITIGGTISAPQNIGLKVNGKAYLYAVQENDTLSIIATALAAAINADTPAHATGAVITITNAFSLEANVGAVGTVQRVLRQQEQMFEIAIFASTPEVRDAVAAFVDQTLAGAGLSGPRQFLAMPDTSVARMIYRGTRMADGAQVQGIYRRDIVVSVDYATTDTLDAAQIVDLNLQTTLSIPT